MTSRTASGPPEVGAYRLRLHGVEGAAGLLGPAPAGWMPLTIERTVATPPEEPQWVGEAAAHLGLGPTGRVHVDRPAAVARFVSPDPIGDAALLHPLLSPVAAVWARWQGWPSFHGGAFVVDGAAWAVLGGRGGGKSTTLGWLCSQGVAVVTDDLLVVKGTTVAAGPRCIDLRPDAAAHLGMGEDLGVVGTRPRWRAGAGPVEPELRLAGWVYLEWGDEVDVAPVRGPDRLVRLLGHRALFLPDTLGPDYLSLAALPAFRFSRPRGMRWLPSTGHLLERLSAARAPGP